MDQRPSNVVAFKNPRKAPQIKYRALPEENIAQQLKDIEDTIRGLFQIRRALLSAFNKRNSLISSMFPVFLCGHRLAIIVAHAIGITLSCI